MNIAQSAVAIEYTDCISAEEEVSPNECPIYDTKQSDGEVPVMLELWECGAPIYCHRSQVHSVSECLHLVGSYLWVK